MATIGAVILAAGESSRFGQPKQLIQIGGRALIEGVIIAAKEAGCQPIIVVTGSNSARIVSALNDNSVSIVENTRWQTGIGSSIRAGVQHLVKIAPDTTAAALLVCDQPFVTGKVVSGLIKQWSATGKHIVASSYDDTLGVPALFDQSCFNELLQIADDKGAKQIILKNRDDVATVPFVEGKIDIDTPNDFATLERYETTTPGKQPLPDK